MLDLQVVIFFVFFMLIKPKTFLFKTQNPKAGISLQ